jgi:hypothetical protein
VISITLDIDWACDEVIADSLQLLADAGLRATLFATHNTTLLRDAGNHEIGIHPNFLPTKDYASVLDKLRETYPSAKGVRCHSYYQSTPILDLFVQRGLKYDSNIVMLRCDGIRAFRHWNGLVRMPVFWEDDVNCVAGGDWDADALSLSDPESLYIFDFHPIHLFLNTETMERYRRAKPHYQDAKKLTGLANPSTNGTGTRVFFKQLLARIKAQKLPTLTLQQIFDSVSC